QLSLLLVGVVGVLLAVNLRTGWLGADWAAALRSHVYLGPVGWFGLLIPGVSYELGPFFGITRWGNEKGRGRFFILVAGLLAGGLVLGLAGVVGGWFRPVLLLPV